MDGMLIASFIGFFALVVSWMALPATAQRKTEAKAAPARAASRASA